MKPPLLPSSKLTPPTFSPHLTLSLSKLTKRSKLYLKPPTIHQLSSSKRGPSLTLTLCSLNSNDAAFSAPTNEWQFVQLSNPKVPPFASTWRSRIGLTDQAFFLLTFILCTTSAAFVGLVAAAVPTLYATGRAANSFAKLVDAAREELPGTMAAIRLSGMEISDLTLELSDLSHEISDGVNKSAQAVQAAEVGIRQIGALAREQTISIIEERANLPVISLEPVVSGAAKKTSRAVGQATRSFMNLFSGGERKSEENR